MIPNLSAKKWIFFVETRRKKGNRFVLFRPSFPYTVKKLCKTDSKKIKSQKTKQKMKKRKGDSLSISRMYYVQVTVSVLSADGETYT